VVGWVLENHSHEPKLKLRKPDKGKGKPGDEAENTVANRTGMARIRALGVEAFVIASPWNPETKWHVWLFLDDYETYARLGGARKSKLPMQPAGSQKSLWNCRPVKWC